ncbi:hypothetical protein P153DRAFT_352955 [Dothidotthia symphoricarpi CBS 119687]|uniref:Malate dehydrogenase n=1 Tax=Dothidotthia symphoricarpi CBS 119687 TaxID=1392245 RepID=A0A6A6AQ70_9PLEO|nr:uncharacterized protein P153DRAFT_352955 [Dothidotthia symphoricarpi CBS 119687]KAF2133686.1 hypothetical protein P153DRAFT_352955 [Dothidotthia symphoricarpi CBS 119687]
MLFSTLSTAVASLALFTGSVSAVPTPNTAVYKPAKDLSRLAKLFPQSDLPSPTDGQVLKYVALGLGTQNYTCLTGDENAVPGTTGALATLYDIGTSLNYDPIAKWKIGSISALALSLSVRPQQLDLNLRSQGFEHMIGHHFFNGSTPTFSLDQLAQPYPVARVAKVAETDPPKSACPGNQGEGAIKWLLLTDTVGISQGGINTVYRVETAGGNKSATCKGKKATFEVAYAAQYWIFGPK